MATPCSVPSVDSLSLPLEVSEIGGHGVHSWLCLPLLSDGFGVLLFSCVGGQTIPFLVVFIAVSCESHPFGSPNDPHGHLGFPSY